MNYYGPRELHEDGEPTGTFHYTRRRGSGGRATVRPLGYCAGKPITTKDEYEERKGDGNTPDTWNPESREAERALDLIRFNRRKVILCGDKYHTHGHDTKEEARQCYTEYCLDFKTVVWNDVDTELKDYHGVSTHGLSKPVEGSRVPADVEAKECRSPECETFVAYPTAMVGGPGLPQKMHLCSEHCSHEHIAEFWEAPMEAMGSY